MVGCDDFDTSRASAGGEGVGGAGVEELYCLYYGEVS
jgi:hypothetical protein